MQVFLKTPRFKTLRMSSLAMTLVCFLFAGSELAFIDSFGTLVLYNAITGGRRQLVAANVFVSLSDGWGYRRRIRCNRVGQLFEFRPFLMCV